MEFNVIGCQKIRGVLKTGEAHPLKRVTARIIKYKGVGCNFLSSSFSHGWNRGRLTGQTALSVALFVVFSLLG